jgi:hypothetical protein
MRAGGTRASWPPGKEEDRLLGRERKPAEQGRGLFETGALAGRGPRGLGAERGPTGSGVRACVAGRRFCCALVFEWGRDEKQPHFWEQPRWTVLESESKLRGLREV